MSRQGVWQGWEAEVQRLLPGTAVLEQALNETHQGHTATGARLGMLALRLIYQERAIPLAWVCYRPGAAPSASSPSACAGSIALAFTSSHPSLAASSLSPDSETVGFSASPSEGEGWV